MSSHDALIFEVADVIKSVVTHLIAFFNYLYYFTDTKMHKRKRNRHPPLNPRQTLLPLQTSTSLLYPRKVC